MHLGSISKITRKSKTSKREKGATLVEAAICLGVFMFLLITGVKLMAAAFTWSALYHAVSVGAKQGVLMQNTLDEIKTQIVSTASGYGISVTPQQIHICDSANVEPDGFSCPAASNEIGVSGEVMHYGITRPYGIVSTNGIDSFMLKVAVLTQNE